MDLRHLAAGVAMLAASAGAVQAAINDPTFDNFEYMCCVSASPLISPPKAANSTS